MLDPTSSSSQKASASQPSLIDAAILGFPSPAGEGIEAASSERVVGHVGRTPTTLCDPFFEPTVTDPFPPPTSSSTALSTPLQEFQPDLNIVGFAGSGFLPSEASLPTPPIVKAGRSLRLPSFDLLGIAAPHPDRKLPNANNPFAIIGAGPLSKPEDPLHDLSPTLSRPHLLGGVGRPPTSSEDMADNNRPSLHHFIPVDTPPAEPGSINWGPFVNVRTAAMGSPPHSDAQSTPGADPSSSHSATVPIAPVIVPIADDSSIPWIQRPKDVIILNLMSANVESVKVLSHALPCPSKSGHCFSCVIDAIHNHTAKPTSWINVFHAVPGRFTLADLPTSPPSTPGPAIGGDDYFTRKIFDSAVAVSDYQGDSKLLPSSPKPVVAPGTVDVSVVERYIPPTNTNEFAEMFSLQGRSLLMDRLAELSPNDGSLLFIYPTKTGARTFMNQYLGPILDPMLRSLAVVHSLSADLGNSLGSMVSVERLLEYDVFLSAIERFCSQLSKGHVSWDRLRDKNSEFSVVYSSKEEVQLDREAWARDMWIKQEKPRVREVVTKYFRAAQKVSTNTDITMPTNLIQEILEGVEKRPYEDGPPEKGIEVGVYVIRRSKRTP